MAVQVEFSKETYKIRDRIRCQTCLSLEIKHLRDNSIPFRKVRQLYPTLHQYTAILEVFFVSCRCISIAELLQECSALERLLCELSAIISCFNKQLNQINHPCTLKETFQFIPMGEHNFQTQCLSVPKPSAITYSKCKHENGNDNVMHGI